MCISDILEITDLDSLNNLTYELLKPQKEVELCKELLHNRVFILSGDYLLPNSYLERKVFDNETEEVLSSIINSHKDGSIDDTMKILQILQLISVINPAVSDKVDYILDNLELSNDVNE